MALSEKEINDLITKLRNRYSEYSNKYNPKWFNIEAFEERLIMAIRNKMNLEGFILAEISNFEKIKEKYEKKKNQKSFSKHVERIMDENIARIKKYPEIKFHPRAGFEIAHFYGSISEFALYYFDVLSILVNDRSLKDIIISLEHRLGFLAAPRGKLPSKRIDDHILLLNRSHIQEIDIEMDKNNFLKESAFTLHEIVDLCDGLISIKNPEWENPLLVNKLFFEEKRKKRMIEIFTGLTGYGAILKVSEHATEIIEDFRLGAFKKQ